MVTKFVAGAWITILAMGALFGMMKLIHRHYAAVSREQLMDRVWGDAFVAVSRSLDVHMTGLRAKLGRRGLIETIRGFGYRWTG